MPSIFVGVGFAYRCFAVCRKRCGDYLSHNWVGKVGLTLLWLNPRLYYKPLNTYIMSIFDKLKKGYSSWTVKSVEKMSEEDLDAIRSIKTFTGEYGKSCLLMLNSGASRWLNFDRDSADRDVVTKEDLAKADIITLQSDGQDDIYRVKF